MPLTPFSIHLWAATMSTRARQGTVMVEMGCCIHLSELYVINVYVVHLALTTFTDILTLENEHRCLFLGFSGYNDLAPFQNECPQSSWLPPPFIAPEIELLHSILGVVDLLLPPPPQPQKLGHCTQLWRLWTSNYHHS